MPSRRVSFLLASAALHLGLFLLAYISWPFWSHKLEASDAVPITIVTRSPTPDIRQAEQARQVQTASTPEPAPEPTPTPPAEEPTPQPKPPPKAPPAKPAPAPTPKPLPAPVPSPKLKPQTKPQPQDLNLDKLAAAKTQTLKSPSDLDLNALAAPSSSRSKAPRGPAKAETDLLARLAVGKATALSGDAMNALQAKLNRLWNPNCEVEGGAGVQVKVEIKLTPNGYLMGSPALVSRAGSGVSGAVIQASVERALSAVRQGEPYTEIPRDGPHDIDVNFNARQACQR